ncbi:unannotated protein [freshwater metagenome]|uniref:Unannotated protein n=1 Tax=freshwater metagenome TaxID=449393 RepID=A0A6J6B213_9ZZZZ
MSSPFAYAAVNRSAPWLASKALLAVTIDLRLLIAVIANSRAGSIPPITSIIKSISGSLTIEKGSVVNSAGSKPG